MNQDGLYNVNVISQQVLETPNSLKLAFPHTERSKQTVIDGRSAIKAILDRQDPRLLIVIGPCSIHDVTAAKDYAQRLKALHNELSDTLFIVMRIYFEKPRTTVGWKGLLSDPFLDDSGDVQAGLRIARELGLWLAELGLPAGTEALDPITPEYLADLFSWIAIGARTTESQKHREMASGLSAPVGFKNGTDGSLDVAVNALSSAATSHRFLGINGEGQPTVLETRGNKYGHVILRGGRQPNYDSVNVRLCEQALEAAGLPLNIMIDCSHANSYKNHELQPLVAENVTHQIINGNRSIIGMMLESHIRGGKQALPAADRLNELEYGKSITDSCISWETTDKLLRTMRAQLKDVLPQRLTN